MKRLAMLALVMILSLCTINPVIAAAETFCDVYFGTSLINADESYIKLNGTTLYAESESKAYAVFGFRYGTWLDNIPCLGVALDLSLNGAVMGDELKPFGRIWSGSTLAMLRLPLLKSKEFPNGQLQPYIAVGPGFFLTTITKVVGPPEVSDFDWFCDESLDLGLDVRTGLSWRLSETKMRLFVEYRYSQFEADFERSIPDGTLSFKPTLQMHYLLLGLGITF
ncbi:MAG: porin family protein [Desulfobacteraceae bacterium]|nr:porin family protein [Desulfobacteraceae bacterium]